MFRFAISVCTLLLAALAQESRPGAAKRKPDGRTLFLAACASCHGTEGKGDGPLKTVPPPRDLSSGRFSFGNTRRAILHTVENGIPPAMPPHRDLLTAAQREAVVDHVLSLMPEQIEMPPRLSTLTVTERPLFVHGSLPDHPRALVLGLPNGLTLAFDGATLRPIGIHEGAFVDRTAWRERGGTPLALLGTRWDLVPLDWLPPASQAELAATEVEALGARLEYRVRRANDAQVLDVVETPRAVAWAEGKVLIRRIVAARPFPSDVRAQEEERQDGEHRIVQRIVLRDDRTLVVVTARLRTWDAGVAKRLAEEVAR